MQLFNIGDEVEIVSEEELQEYATYYPDDVKALFGKVGTVGDVEFDDWNEQYVYRIDIDGAKKDTWFMESMLSVYIPEGKEEIEVKGQMKTLLNYVDAFFQTRQVVGQIHGTKQTTIIKVWTGLYEVLFIEREEGNVQVTLRDRIQEAVLAIENFTYVGEENVLVPEINVYLETAGVI